MRIEPRRLARRARGAALRLMGARATANPAGARLLDLDDIASLPRTPVEEISRGLASPVYLGDHVALCRILARYKLFLDSRDVAFGAHVLLDGYWEAWLTRFVARNVREGSVVADVGANFGYYTLLLADLVGPGGRVFAIEPNPAAVALLRRSVMLNGFAARVEIVEAAAGDEDGGAATLWVPAGRPGGAALVDPSCETPSDCVRNEVPVRSLDAVLAGEKRLDFVKVDAEGSEERILAGMTEVIARHRPMIVLEFNAGWYSDPAGFLDRLAAVYGSLAHIDHHGNAAPVERDRLLATAEEWLLLLRPA